MRTVGHIVLWLSLLLIAVTPAHAQGLDEAAYSDWVVDHAQRLVAAMRLPNEFHLADLRDIADTLGELVEEARGVVPPSRYAAAHAVYLASLERVDRVRDALLAVVITRAPVPELGERAFEAGQSVAAALRDLREAGVVLPPAVIALFGPDQSPVAAGAANPANGNCGAGTCGAGPRLSLRVLTRVEVESANRLLRPRRDVIVALRVRIQNEGTEEYRLSRESVRLEGADGVQRPLVRVSNGGPDLVPPSGLLLGPGESREGAMYFVGPRAGAAQRLWIGTTGEPVTAALP